MASREQAVSWSADGRAIAHDVNELDSLIDDLAAEHGDANPIIVIVDGPGHESVYFGVGGDRSFISSVEEPYLTTVGSDSLASDIDFFFEGHHSPVPGKNFDSGTLGEKDSARVFCDRYLSFVAGLEADWP